MDADAQICDAGRETSRGPNVPARTGLVVYSHLPSEDIYESELYEVAGIECVGNHDYWRGLERHWDKGQTLVIVEHDIGVSDDLIQGLLDCPHPQCTYAYKLYWPSTYTLGEHYAQRHGMNGAWVEEGAPICDFTGIAFCKVAPGAFKRGSLTDEDHESWHWTEVDIAVTKATEGPWHVHWPAVEHSHQ